MTISRAEVCRRALTVRPERSVWYDQGSIAADGWRPDCSGFVCLCWNIPPAEHDGWGGQSTVTLVTAGYITEISPQDLQPGDAVGICGSGTEADNGHIVLFRGWFNNDPNDDRYYASEQSGGQLGPVHRIITYPYDGAGGSWRAWRYRAITDGGSMAEVEIPGGFGDYLPDTAMAILVGQTPRLGYPEATGPQWDNDAITRHNLAAVEARLMAKLDAIAAQQVTGPSAADVAREIIAQLRAGAA
jgi:hypothetical protein